MTSTFNNDRSIRRGTAGCGRKDKVILKSDRESYGYFIYSSINDFMTFRYTYKALGVLEPFKEFYLV
jgi:hypothetical protein